MLTNTDEVWMFRTAFEDQFKSCSIDADVGHTALYLINSVNRLSMSDEAIKHLIGVELIEEASQAPSDEDKERLIWAMKVYRLRLTKPIVKRAAIKAAAEISDLEGKPEQDPEFSIDASLPSETLNQTQAGETPLPDDSEDVYDGVLWQGMAKLLDGED